MITFKEALGSTILVAALAGLGVKKSNDQGPQLHMPQVTFMTVETNEAINSLLQDAMEKCLSRGNMEAKTFLHQKKVLLGEEASRVKAFCGQPTWKTNEFRMQIDDRIFRTQDGTRFDPVGTLSLK